MEWLIQTLEGSARREVLTRAAREADTATQVLAFLAATFGDHRGLSALLTSFHGRRQEMGESVVSGVRAAAPADADHQAERSAGGCRQSRYALQPFYRRAAPPHSFVATFVATPGSMLTAPSIRHRLRRLCAGCARMLMWRCEQSRSWWLNSSTKVAARTAKTWAAVSASPAARVSTSLRADPSPMPGSATPLLFHPPP